MTEILGDTSMPIGERFVIAQQLIAGITPATKAFDKHKKALETWAKDNLKDDGSGKSEAIKHEGAEIMIKYSYPKPSWDGDKLAEELQRTYAEINATWDDTQFLKPATPRKSVVIQSII